MEYKKALKIPFKVDKDNLMENPFRIPITCVSPECEKFEKQVSWTEFSSRKRRHCDSQHKNGSMLFDHNLAAKITLEFQRKKPCVMLKDILKTECGRAHLDRIKRSCNLGNQAQGPRTSKECGHHKEEPSAASRDRTPNRISANKDRNRNETPKCNKKSTTSSSHRSQLRKRLQNVDNEAEKEEKAIDGKAREEDYKFAEIVDCGFSMRWEPSKDTEECPEFSPASMRETWTDPEKEVLQGFKRRKKPSASPCNGASSPKRRSESVLRLSGGDRQEGKSALSPICLEDGAEDGGDGGRVLANVDPENNRENDRDGKPLSVQVCLEESEEDRDFENIDHSVVQFTVGADDPRDFMIPVVSPSSESGDFISTSRQSLSPSQDVPTTTSPSEPIVLSSDDEEGCVVSQRSSQAARKPASLEDAVMREESAEEDKPQEASDTEAIQLYQVFLDDLPPEPVSILPKEDYTSVAFSSLYSGAYHFRSNGQIMIADQKIFIQLKDVNDRLEGVVTFEGKEMRWYSVWELQEMEAEQLFLKFDVEPPPPTALLLCVSEAAAAAVQQELFKLCERRSQNTNTGEEAHTTDTGYGRLSPFILLTLREPLEGIEGTLFRSLLELDCHKNPEAAKPLVPLEEDGFPGLTDLNSHVLPVADSIRLIRGTGLDSHLLSLLDLDNTDPSQNLDQDDLLSDSDQNQTVLIQVARDSKKGTVLGLESVAVSSIQVQTDKDQKDQTLEAPSENKQEEPTSVYTLCHRRTRGSYSVLLCKPDSSWTKYRHQSVARRLIQFPPPPLKGGITVTMEDLQCLDSGQFLNDVIIDFYLKYLLHKALAAVAERTHIFSSFFYKQLTRRDNASEGSIKDSCQRQRRHQRVKTWTRHVDIFQKDFLFVPVNQEAHWYLVVICFPGLTEPTSEAWNGPCSQMGKSNGAADELQEQESAQGSRSPNDSAEASPTVINSVGANTETEKSQEESSKDQKPGPVSCTERTCQKRTVCKRPCILVMDSLKRSLHERVFKLLRDYLESEWEVRRGSVRDFGADQMQNSHCRVPLQDNSSDCGLYLLQYVESFLEDPVVHFDLPLHLERWFPRQQVRRKRDEIRDLVLNLYRHQNLDSNR